MLLQLWLSTSLWCGLKNCTTADEQADESIAYGSHSSAATLVCYAFAGALPGNDKIRRASCGAVSSHCIGVRICKACLNAMLR